MIKYIKELKFEIDLFRISIVKSIIKIYRKEDIETYKDYLFQVSEVLCTSSVEHDRQIYTRVKRYLLKHSNRYIKKNYPQQHRQYQFIVQTYIDWLAQKINQYTYDCYTGDKSISRIDFDIMLNYIMEDKYAATL